MSYGPNLKPRRPSPKPQPLRRLADLEEKVAWLEKLLNRVVDDLAKKDSEESTGESLP